MRSKQAKSNGTLAIFIVLVAIYMAKDLFSTYLKISVEKTELFVTAACAATGIIYLLNILWASIPPLKNLKIFKSKITVVIVSGAFGLLFYICREWINQNIIKAIDLKSMCYITIAFLLFFIAFIVYEKINPIIRLLRVAKFKGYYKPDYVDNIIFDSTLNSSMIKMKITRAHSLFVESNNQSFKKVIEKVIREFQDKELEFKILLHVPCQLSDHVINRAKANNYNTSTDKFVETWFQTISILDAYSANPINKVKFQIKFYSEKHTKWRFFIFNHNAINKAISDDGSKKIMLFDYYDSDSPSYREDMYKVGYEKNSLLSDFEAYFDHLWDNNSRESIDAMEYLRDFFGETDSVLTPCSCCVKRTNCANMKNKYDGFNPTVEAA